MRNLRPGQPEPHIPMCVLMSGEAAICPMITTRGQTRCHLAEQGTEHLHCSLGHIHRLDNDGNILDAPATG